MKTWKECCKEADYDQSLKAPEITYLYYAYKNGKSAVFSSATEARLKFSSNIESCADADSKAAYDNFWKNQGHKEQQASEIWYAALKEEFKDIPLSIFNLCYDKAYDRAHHGGRDSMYEEMENFVDFANDILKTQK